MIEIVLILTFAFIKSILLFFRHCCCVRDHSFNFYSLIYQIIFIFFQALLLAVLEKLLGSDSKSCSCLRRCWVTWNGNVNITWNVACAWQVYVTGWDLLRLALNLLLLELEKLLELQVMLRLKLLHLLRDPVWWCWYLLRRLISNFLILEAVNSHCGGEHFRMIRLRNAFTIIMIDWVEQKEA